jgi:hypothetical protein
MTLPLVPTSQPTTSQNWNYLLARAINALIQGRSNSADSFTLTANAGSTVVLNNLFQSSSVPVFVPTTANAAAALATTYVSARANGSFTLTHTNNAQADKTFLYVFWG